MKTTTKTKQSSNSGHSIQQISCEIGGLTAICETQSGLGVNSNIASWMLLKQNMGVNPVSLVRSWAVRAKPNREAVMKPGKAWLTTGRGWERE